MSPVALGAHAPDLALPATPRGIEEQQRLRGKPPLVVAREFEAILVAQMIGVMRQTIPSSGLLQPASAHRMLDGAFDQEVARSLVARTDFGIARQLAAQLERRTGARHEPVRLPPTAPGLVGAPLRTDAASPRGARQVAPAGASPASATSVPVATTIHSDGVALAVEPTGRVAGAPPQAIVVAPVEGRVTSRFGARRDPITGAPEFHAGVDLAARRGARVRAVASGQVIFAGRRGEAGNVIDVQHAGNLVTSYAHVGRTLVHTGQKVAAGDVLATVGSSGHATGPHLHFAVRHDGQPIDPAKVLGGDLLHAGSRIGRRRTSPEV